MRPSQRWGEVDHDSHNPTVTNDHARFTAGLISNTVRARVLGKKLPSHTAKPPAKRILKVRFCLVLSCCYCADTEQAARKSNPRAKQSRISTYLNHIHLPH